MTRSELPSIRVIAALLGDACEQNQLALSAEERAALASSVDDIARGMRDLGPSPEAAVQFRSHWAESDLANGWASRCEIQTSTDGLLKDLRFAAKDNMLVAGVPCGMGSNARPALVPSTTSVAVQRCLDAGAVLLGKAQCEDFCQASQSFTSRPAPVVNPVVPSRSAGGSSSGSAALVAAGAVDFALGTDSGGSVRLPASYCGVVGLKPTWGAIPFQGVFPLEPTLEHVGPITRTVSLNEQVFSVLAGNPNAPRSVPSNHRPLRIGLLTEARQAPQLAGDIAELLDATCARALQRGAEVVPISVPEHLTAQGIHMALYVMGIEHTIRTTGRHIGAMTAPSEEITDALARWVADPRLLPAALRLLLATAQVLRETVGEGAYASAQRARGVLRAAYDQALSDVDVLLLQTADELPPPVSIAPPESLQHISESLGGTEQTCAFNVTGHPSISLPIGRVASAPVGGMLVAKHWDEATLYRASRLCALDESL